MKKILDFVDARAYYKIKIRKNHSLSRKSKINTN